MNSRGFSLIELMIVMTGLALMSLAMGSIFSFAARQSTDIATKGDAQTELSELHRDIRKAIMSRKSDIGELPLEPMDVEAFPGVGGACGNIVLDPPCSGLLIRQTSPLDPTGAMIQLVEIESSCEELPLANRADIPENLQLEPEAFPTYHPALCCPANTVPVVKIRTTPNKDVPADYTEKIYPYKFYGAAACFRLKNDKSSMSVELVGLAQGPQSGVPVAIEKTETITLIRNSNVEILPN